MDVSSLTINLPAGDGVPEWVHLLPAGTFTDTSGVTYHLRDAQAVVAATMARGKIALDENHSTQRATPAGQPSPARAWISEYQIRADGIWGKPEWNATGTALMTDKSYRHISPVYKFDNAASRNVEYLISAALTNDPGLKQLTALHSNNGNNMDKVAICTALGIAPTAEDAAVLTALQTAAGASTALQTAQSEVARLNAELTALKTNSVSLTMAAELNAELAALKADSAKAKAIAFVDGEIAKGKPIVAIRENVIALHSADPKAAEALVAGMPSLKAAGAGGKFVKLQDAGAGDEDVVEMTASDMAVCAATGVSKEDFMKQKKAMMATSEGSAA